MDSGTHGFFAVGGIGMAAALYGISRLNLREILDVSKPGAYWKVVAMIFMVLNLKSLPFAWHYRLLKGLLSHVTLGPRCPKSPGPAALFQPLITSSRTSLWETDYNGHKSNSTYFADLDIARMHLITCLLKTGLHRAHYEKPTAENESKYGKTAGGGRLAVMLGGVSCHFRREIKPYQSYEIWTRVLAWDRKWIYLVSHIVRKGTFAPTKYSQQPSKKAPGAQNASASGVNDPKKAGRGSDRPIFATSIAKYVFKSGRITIPPELVLSHGGLLPSKPESAELETGEEENYSDQDLGVLAQSFSDFSDDDLMSSTHFSENPTWQQVDTERVRGMSIARHFANLDQLDGEFTANKTAALGRW